MQCDICLRSSSARLSFNCITCAQNAVYEPRIQLVQTLLQKEALGKEVERNIAVVSTGSKNKTSSAAKSTENHSSWVLEQTCGEQVASNERTQVILTHIEALRKETDDMKIEIAKKKAKLLKRRSDLKSASDESMQREAVILDPMEKTIRRVEHRWDAMHTKTAESRMFLCQEAAHLYGLQQRKRKRGGSGRDVYLIGGIPIVDLRDLNNASPAHITASTTSLAHLVHLVSHYLSVRLPAEIILSHRDYPLPTIFSPGSSYNSRDIPFPGSTPSHSSSNSPSASRMADQRSLPRPRPLYFDKKISALAKEDPVAYAFFVEGITFLAWDIAWMCKTQGLDVGANSWEEVCAVGKNLWQLLVSLPLTSKSPSPAPITKTPSTQEFSRPAISRVPTSTPLNPREEVKSPLAMLGHFSHGTAHSFLAAANGVEYMRGWRLQMPLRVVEKVKAMLLSERTGAEWEILEGNEWEDETGAAEVGKDWDGKGREGDGVGVGVGMTGEEEGKGKGTSGWMKLKSRGGL